MSLAEFITSNIEPILAEWEAYARGIDASKGMNSAELRDHARQMLQVIVADLGTPQSAQQQADKSHGLTDSIESASGLHGSGRARSGFTVEDLISEYRALRASVLRLWGKRVTSAQRSDLEDVTRFNEAIDQALAEAVGHYSSLTRQSQDLFLGILGHDLREPLGAIGMSAQFMLHDASLGSRHVKAAAIISSNTKQMSRLIDDLLTFARTRLGQGMPVSLQRADLAEIVGQAVAQARAFHPDHAITLDIQGDLHGWLDSERIGQVFANLLRNAVMHGGENEPIKLELCADGEDLVATVNNRGKPIEVRDLPHIFEPLYRSDGRKREKTDRSSVGLGLYISRELIQAHGGSIAVESSAEAGTTFTVRLPRSPAAR